MSSVFQMHCEPCDVDGPRIHRSASGGAWLLPRDTTAWTDEEKVTAMNEWSDFLVQHDGWEIPGVHDIQLRRES